LRERIVLKPGAPWRAEAERAAAVLREGGVALLPAEGVYGLHVLAADAAAVDRLLALKPRGPEKSYIGLIADPAEIGRWSRPSVRADELARTHWPGALTLVLPALPSVPESMRHPGGTIALRCPGNEFLRAVVASAGGLVISTSANEPGVPAMVRPEGPSADRADLVVDQGALSGVPSTVVAVEGEDLRVLREGAVPVTGRRT
jgi:tRNA threonylcarbamoyl adenosine modification protein (Sua5/YciO/YrdC/YwlC family)